jgi:hypothetical protein
MILMGKQDLDVGGRIILKLILQNKGRYEGFQFCLYSALMKKSLLLVATDRTTRQQWEAHNIKLSFHRNKSPLIAACTVNCLKVDNWRCCLWHSSDVRFRRHRPKTFPLDSSTVLLHGYIHFLLPVWWRTSSSHKLENGWITGVQKHRTNADCFKRDKPASIQGMYKTEFFQILRVYKIPHCHSLYN